MAIPPINIDRINEIWMDPRGQRAYVQKDAGSNGQSRVTFGADAWRPYPPGSAEGWCRLQPPEDWRDPAGVRRSVTQVGIDETGLIFVQFSAGAWVAFPPAGWTRVDPPEPA